VRRPFPDRDRSTSVGSPRFARRSRRTSGPSSLPGALVEVGRKEPTRLIRKHRIDAHHVFHPVGAQARRRRPQGGTLGSRQSPPFHLRQAGTAQQRTCSSRREERIQVLPVFRADESASGTDRRAPAEELSKTASPSLQKIAEGPGRHAITRDTRGERTEPSLSSASWVRSAATCAFRLGHARSPAVEAAPAAH